MANDKVTIWGGQARFGRNPVEDEYLVGDADGNFVLTPIPTPYTAPVPPVFSVTLSADQTITSGIYTKINFDTVVFDPEGYFDTVNYQYKPLVAGYYQVNVLVDVSGTNIGSVYGGINKNGSEYAETTYFGSQISTVQILASTIIHLNGSTDYIDFYAVGSTTSGNVIVAGGPGKESYCYFTGSLIRFD